MKLNDENVFTITMQFYLNNLEEFQKATKTYDCKELCRQLVLKNWPIEFIEGGYTPQQLLNFGKDWSKKEKISSNERQFGSTFAYWSYVPPIGDHAAIYFGRDSKNMDYYFSKNGIRGPLVIATIKQLQEIYSLWNAFRSDYKFKK